jgi:hypothetical protein
VIDLEELSLPECNLFLKAVQFAGNAHEKFKILSVTGGVPRYLEEIKSDRLADENIKLLCFDKTGVLFREFQEIFLDVFAKRGEAYKKIVEILVEGDKEFSEISESLLRYKSGHLSEHLNDLIQSGFIKRDYTWNIKDETKAGLSHYRLSDNYLRFYLKYVEKNKIKIENNYFEKISLSTFPAFNAIMGLQFENLVLNNRSFIWEKLNLNPQDIVTDNPYFQRQQLRKKGCQIDYLIQTKMKLLYACEIKFSKDILRSDVIEEMHKKLDRFYLPRGYSIQPVLIHVNGVADSVVDADYFSQLIDFTELLN